MRRRRFNRNFPKNLNLICFVLSLSPRNGNNPWEFSKCRHFALIVLQWNSCRFHSFVRIHFSQVKSMRTHFCRCVLAEREKLDFSVVFIKAGFLPMDNEIVLMKANKGRIYYLYQDFFRFLKPGLKINRNSEPWGTIVLEGALLSLVKILPMNSESFAKKPLKFITHMGVLTSNKTDNFVCEIPRATLEFIVIHTLASEVDLQYQAIVGGKWTSSS